MLDTGHISVQKLRLLIIKGHTCIAKNCFSSLFLIPCGKMNNYEQSNLNTAICFTVYTKKKLEVYVFVYCLTVFRKKLLEWLCFCVCAGSSHCSVSGLNVFEGNNRNVMEIEDDGSNVNFHFFEPLGRYYFHNFSMNL